MLTARAADRGQAAAAEVKLGAAAGSEVLFHPLDITDAASIQRFAAWAQAELQQVDVLVNNAGMAYKGNTFGAEEAAATIATNFYGTAAVCEALLGGGLIPGGGRIINVGSSAGKLSIVRDPALRSKFEAAASKAELAQLADGFVDAIRRGRHAPLAAAAGRLLCLAARVERCRHLCLLACRRPGLGAALALPLLSRQAAAPARAWPAAAVVQALPGGLALLHVRHLQAG